MFSPLPAWLWDGCALNAVSNVLRFQWDFVSTRSGSHGAAQLLGSASRSTAPCQRVCVLQRRANSEQYVGLISLQPILAPCMGETSLGRELSFAPLFSPRLLTLSRRAAPGTGSPRRVASGADGDLSLHEMTPEPPDKPSGHHYSLLALITVCRAAPSPQTRPSSLQKCPSLCTSQGSSLSSFLGKGLEAAEAGCHLLRPGSAFSGPTMCDQLHAEHLLCPGCANLSPCSWEGRAEEVTEEGLSQLAGGSFPPPPLLRAGRFAL